MQLRWSPMSPFARKALATAIETGLRDEMEIVETRVWDPSTDIGETNPLGKIPALILEDGTILFDSPVICEYLDARAATGLLPAAGDARWRILRQQALADGLLDATVGRLLEERRPAEQQSAAWIERHWAAVTRALDSIEQSVDALDGPITLGSLTTAIALDYLDFRFSQDDWRAGRPASAAWRASLAGRPSLDETMPREFAD